MDVNDNAVILKDVCGHHECHKRDSYTIAYGYNYELNSDPVV